MNIFFDVQGTLVSGGGARPNVREVFLELTETGHRVYVWSSGGGAYAKRAAESLGVDDLACGYFSKAEPPPVSVDFAVDDHPATVGAFANGYLIEPFDGDPEDDELSRVLEEVRRASSGTQPP